MMLCTRRLAVVVMALAPLSAFAQTAAPDFSVPTTKVLAIGSFTPKATLDVVKSIIGPEVRATVRLYLTGKMDQWYVKPDQSGVVFIMNCSSVQEARELLEKLPMGPAGVMEFQFTAMGPISPLRVLLTEPAK
ncbi:hypothetical protein BH09PSE6_BH09PSE6_00770 [soil metagenome]